MREQGSVDGGARIQGSDCLSPKPATCHVSSHLFRMDRFSHNTTSTVNVDAMTRFSSFFLNYTVSYFLMILFCNFYSFIHLCIHSLTYLMVSLTQAHRHTDTHRGITIKITVLEEFTVASVQSLLS